MRAGGRRDTTTGANAPAFHPIYLRVLGAVLARRAVEIPALLQASRAPIRDEDAMLPLAPAREWARWASWASPFPRSTAAPG